MRRTGRLRQLSIEDQEMRLGAGGSSRGAAALQPSLGGCFMTDALRLLAAAFGARQLGKDVVCADTIAGSCDQVNVR